MNFAALILSLMAFVIGLAATPSISQTDEPRAVVLDSWWSGTWAKNGCEYVKIFVKSNERLINQIGCKSVTSCPTLMPRYAACLAAAINGPDALAHDFEDELMIQFGINPKCKSATFARYYGPETAPSAALSAAMEMPHWTLTIEFNIGSSAQQWSLHYLSGPLLTGEGATLAKIASDVCTIVMGHGGR